MMERGTDARDELHRVPPDPELVKTYWQWWHEVIMWPAAPRTFRTFWEKVEASTVLDLWCTHSSFERKWLHALLYHLGQMWSGGRKRMDLDEDILRGVCVLDLIVQGLLPAENAQGHPVENWERSALIRRADTYLEQQRPSGSMHAHFIEVLNRSSNLTSEMYRRDIRAHLSR
jgi:hypothetical protein